MLIKIFCNNIYITCDTIDIFLHLLVFVYFQIQFTSQIQKLLLFYLHESQMNLGLYCDLIWLIIYHWKYSVFCHFCLIVVNIVQCDLFISIKMISIYFLFFKLLEKCTFHIIIDYILKLCYIGKILMYNNTYYYIYIYTRLILQNWYVYIYIVIYFLKLDLLNYIYIIIN